MFSPRLAAFVESRPATRDLRTRSGGPAVRNKMEQMLSMQHVSKSNHATLVAGLAGSARHGACARGASAERPPSAERRGVLA